MNPIQRVLKNSALVFAGKLLYKIFAFGVMWYIARRWGAIVFGKFSYVTSFISMFTPIAAFGLDILVTREVARRRSAGNRYLWNVLAAKGLLAAAVGLVMASILVFHDPGDNKAKIIAIMAVATIVLFNMIRTFVATFQAHERMEFELVIMGVIYILYFLGSYMVIYLQRMGKIPFKLEGIAMVFLLANTVGIAVGILLIRRNLFVFHPRISWRMIRTLLVVSLPLALYLAFYVEYQNVDIILLEWLGDVKKMHMSKDAMVGIYSQSKRLLFFIMMIPVSVMQALFPVFTRMRHDRNGMCRIGRIALKYLMVGMFPVVVGGMVLSDQIIHTLWGHYTVISGQLLRVLLIGMLPFSVYMVYKHMILAIKRSTTATRWFGTALAVNILANIVLVPRFAYRGSAGAFLLTEFMLAFGFYVSLKRHLEPLKLRTLLPRPVFASAVMATAIYPIREMNLFVVMGIGALVYSLTVVLLRTFNRRELELLLYLMRSRAKDPSGVFAGRLDNSQADKSAGG